MKSSGWKWVASASFLLVCAYHGYALDREAFTFTRYELNIRIEPEQQRLGIRGNITLRNDSASPQKNAILQISSSLSWRSIQSSGKPLQYVTQPYTSDIDHTGALSEAVITLPEMIAPKSSLDLEIAYEGVIVLDATRLTRIGTPDASAQSTDWDQISEKFTAVRGIGYVTWYPVATEAANLSDGNNLLETLDRWKTRHLTSVMHASLTVQFDGHNETPELLLNPTTCPVAHEVPAAHETKGQFVAECTFQSLALVPPLFVIANYEIAERNVPGSKGIAVHYSRGHDAAAASYVDAEEKALPLVTNWLGALRRKAETADLPNAEDAPYESGALLLTPIVDSSPQTAGLVATHQLTHAAFSSPRPWINEGLAHLMQALYVEHLSGRKAALDYMGLHASSLREMEKQTGSTRPESSATQSLVNTSDPDFYRSKAAYVWWMLRDMLGDGPMQKAVASYNPEQDQEPSYLPRLIQAQTQRDLEWFFDDWVYRDRGLPNFKIESAFARKTLPDGYLLTITVDNLGGAGAEVPLTIKFTGGEISKRVEVHGRSNAVFRVDVPKKPTEIVVNDGSVPESDTANNVFKVDAAQAK